MARAPKRIRPVRTAARDSGRAASQRGARIFDFACKMRVLALAAPHATEIESQHHHTGLPQPRAMRYTNFVMHVPP